MESMVRCGRVMEVKNGRAVVRLVRVESCSSCGRTGCCSGARELEVESPAPAGIRPGDEVHVEMRVPNPALSAAILFLAPLILLMAGLLANGLKGLLIGLGLMAVWYIGVAVWDRSSPRRAEREPRIVERPPAGHGGGDD